MFVKSSVDGREDSGKGLNNNSIWAVSCKLGGINVKDLFWLYGTTYDDTQNNITDKNIILAHVYGQK